MNAWSVTLKRKEWSHFIKLCIYMCNCLINQILFQPLESVLNGKCVNETCKYATSQTRRWMKFNRCNQQQQMRLEVSLSHYLSNAVIYIRITDDCCYCSKPVVAMILAVKHYYSIYLTFTLISIQSTYVWNAI